MNKRLAKIAVAVLTTLLMLVVLWQFRVIVVYVLISLMLAASIRPMFRHLEGRRLIIRLIWILFYIVAMGGFCFLVFLAIRTSAAELQNLSKSVSIRNEWTLTLWPGSTFQQEYISRLPPPSVLFQAVIGNEGELVVPALLGVAQGVGGVLTAIAIILILSVYWGFNQIHFERLWLSILPSDQRKRARGVWRTIEPEIGAYIRGQAIQSMLIGILLGLGYWLIGSPSPVLLASIGALASLIPVVGSVLVIISTLLVGLLTSLQLSLFTVLYTLIVLIVMLIWIKPRLIKHRRDNPILTVILIIALADAFGIIGIIVAPPISVICQILWNRLVSNRIAAGAATQISDLKERLVRVRETVSTMEEPHPPLVTSTVGRITNLIAAAEPLLKGILLVEPSEPTLLPEQQEKRESTRTD